MASSVRVLADDDHGTATTGADVQAILAAGQTLANTLADALHESRESRRAIESAVIELAERLVRLEKAVAEIAQPTLNAQPPAANAPLPLLLSVDDVARLLSVSPRQARRMQAQGRLPTPQRMGRGGKYEMATLESDDGGKSFHTTGEKKSRKTVGQRRWRRELILDWIAAGTPEPEKWQAKWEAEHPTQL